MSSSLTPEEFVDVILKIAGSARVLLRDTQEDRKRLASALSKAYGHEQADEILSELRGSISEGERIKAIVDGWDDE